MEGRPPFVQDALSDRFTMGELCARYGFSRQIGYKWLARYEAEGRAELQDHSRAPHQCPHRIPKAVEVPLLKERQARPFWGARKLLQAQETQYLKIDRWPAASTAVDLLARHGLVQKRRRSRASVHPGVVRHATAAPNDLCTADFKGQFRTGNLVYCYPLTIAAQPTRFLLKCRGLLSTQTVTAKPAFERVFRASGLPIAILSDNGVPFATQAIHGLSYLNVWWMQLGIAHLRNRLRCPRQNGAHERMHRPLKRQAIKPVRATCASQQRNLNALRREYNTERPHERLGQETPASQNRDSPRPYPDRPRVSVYPRIFLFR